MPTPEEILAVPAPWTLKATIYSFMTYVTPAAAKNFPAFIYNPLEAEEFAASGNLLGGLASVQVVRYSDSPVGPYDELLVVPGKFAFEKDEAGKDGKIEKKRKVGLRLTRIYVSQKQTCWNGRTNWNIPKHLARFTFTDLPDGSTAIAVYPPTKTSSPVTTFSSKPFFSATYKPLAYVPSFPMSTSLAGYIGMDLHLYQPPLPSGNTDENVAANGDGKEGELPGTDSWCKIMPYEYSKKTSLGWWDMKRGDGKSEDSPLIGNEDTEAGDTDGDVMDAEEGLYSLEENWWPGSGRWKIGVKMEDATVIFDKAERWGSRL